MRDDNNLEVDTNTFGFFIVLFSSVGRVEEYNLELNNKRGVAAALVVTIIGGGRNANADDVDAIRILVNKSIMEHK